MTQQDEISAIEQLQNTLSNIKVFTAIPMGVLMILYFFSYATLVDKGMTGALFFEIITTILFILALVYLNQVSFAVIKYLYKNKMPYRDLLRHINAKNINDKAEQLSAFIQHQRQASGS